MSTGLIVDGNDRIVGWVRICYVRAWDDLQWCEQHGIISPKERRAIVARRGAAKRYRRARRSRQVRLVNVGPPGWRCCMICRREGDRAIAHTWACPRAGRG